MKTLALVLSLALPGAFVGCGAHPVEQAQASVPVRVASAQVQTFRTTLEVSGNLVAIRSVTIGADTSGRLVSLNVRIGDRVRSGSLLASIDSSGYAASVDQARGANAAAAASIGVSRAQLEQVQTRARLAATSAARMSSLYSQGVISRQQYDESQAGLRTAQAGVDQSQAAINAASGTAAESSGALAAAQVPLAHTAVIAPFDGIITATSADVGAVMNPGSAIVTLQDDRNLEVELAVPEALAAELQAGAPVRVRIDALGSQARGRVRAVIPSTSPDLHVATVRVSVAPNAKILPGMFARVLLPAKSLNSIAVPSKALVTRAGQTGVFAIDAGRARFVPIEAGNTEGANLQVRGLRAGTVIALTNLERLTDGTAVSRQP